ncbi:MAG: hypothetical protein M1835_006909 [Candelina submexicana]|nr:MAG: hypothetical protein M1835_006909 [Candelina submexicana]
MTHFDSGHYPYAAQPVNNYHHLASAYNNGYSHHAESLHFPTASGSAQSHSPGSVAGNPILRGNQSPPVKHEHQVPLQTKSRAFEGRAPTNPKLPNNEPDSTFGTDVDTLMKAIQTKSEPSLGCSEHKHSSLTQMTGFQQPRFGQVYGTAYLNQQFNVQFTAPNAVLDGAGGRSGQKEARQRNKTRYTCEFPNCLRSFSQKTHLEIHTRAHTGVKPFSCKECHQTFSQLGNLKTHERRHTGERPYACEICHKRFSQRGNVRAHRIVHDGEKPFVCRLEECSKQFTQLGNLKSHQNKFHTEALRKLTQKFTRMREGDLVTAADKELWAYFAALYKNSNKGIKGRGKDRRISTTSRPERDDIKTDPITDMKRSRSGSSSEQSSANSETGNQSLITGGTMRQPQTAASTTYEQVQRQQPQSQYDGYGQRDRYLAFVDRKPY